MTDPIAQRDEGLEQECIRIINNCYTNDRRSLRRVLGSPPASRIVTRRAGLGKRKGGGK
jgi:hypothetical protein